MRWTPTWTWALLALACLLSVLATRQAHTVGDDSEYLLMNQSLLEHGSVDVREGDTFALLVNLPKPWRGHVRRFVRRTPPRGYFESNDGSLHSYHFPFYSLAALPLKGLLHLFGLCGNLLLRFFFTLREHFQEHWKHYFRPTLPDQ